MKKTLLKVYKEIIQNADIYITLLIAVIVGVLGIMQSVSLEIVSAVILATLGLIAFSLLSSRRAISENSNTNKEVFAKLSELSSVSKVSDVFREGYPNLVNEIRTAKSIKVFSIGLTTTIIYYFDFQQMLSKDGTIQFLVSDKSDALMNILAFRGSGTRDPEKYKIAVNANLERAITLQRHLQNSEQIEFREIPYFPTYGIFIIEDQSGETKIHIQLNAFRTGGNQNPGFIVTKEDGHWFEHFQEQFEMAWEAGTPVE